MPPAAPAVLQLGQRLVELCRARRWRDAIETLYADDARHVEAYPMGDMPRENGPKAKLLEMNDWWEANHVVHGAELQGPYPHGDDRFAVRMAIDVTPKTGPMNGRRHTMDEVCLYTVADGRITRAEFFWDPTGYDNA
jgi:hypothetical protein